MFQQLESAVKRRVVVAALTITMLVLIIVICAAVIIINSESDKTDAQYYNSGAVAADVGKCSDIGVEILRKGGTAIDSAVATLLCQGATNVHSSGIGGGLFMVVYIKKLGKAWFYNGREKAPANASKDMFVNNSQSKQGEVKLTEKTISSNPRFPKYFLYKAQSGFKNTEDLVCHYYYRSIISGRTRRSKCHV